MEGLLQGRESQHIEHELRAQRLVFCVQCAERNRNYEQKRRRIPGLIGGAFGARCAHRCRFSPYMLGLDPVFPWAAMAQGRVIGEAYQRSARTLDHRVLACERERKGCERREIAEGRITEYVYAPFLFPPAQVVAGGRPTLSHTTKMNVKSMTIVGQRVISETKTRVDPTKTSGGGGWA